MNWNMTEQDFADVEHLLPETVTLMISVIGVEKTLHMVQNHGGEYYPITNGRRKSRAAEVLHAMLAEEVGEEAACKLEKAFAGESYIPIPLCWNAMRELRNRFIRRQYDEMAAQGLSDLLIVRYLVREHKISTRNIRYILKAPDNFKPQPQPAQHSLFVA